MKKIISIVLAAVLLLCISPFAFAANFDYQSVLASRVGYEYNTRDHYWTYYKAYVYTYSDAIVIIGLESYGENGGSNPELTELYCRIQDNSGEKLSTVTSVEIKIGGTTYSYDKLYEGSWSSSAFIGDKGLKLLKALRDCNASDVSIKLGAKNGYIYTIKIDKTKLTNSLKEFSRIYLKYNMNDYMVGNMNAMEEQYPLKINGKLA
ncbi:MAG: hypothetical protein K6C12_13135 [Oscillospiraceae bacterium]|nr:hypothetical protein [Oscillospiraceae bacterium]